MHDTGLNDRDTALDRDIKRAMAVDPSPEFAARIRRRIAAEPAPGTASVRWVWAAAALALTAIAWIVLAPMRIAPTRVEPLIARTLSYVGAPVAPVLPLIGRPYGAQPSRAPGRTVSRRRNTVAPAAPEILIDAREARAIRAFLDGVHEGRIDVRPLANVVPGIEPGLKRDIYIAPIVIDSVATALGPEGVPQ